MSTPPDLRATLESGDVVDDPSEDALLMMLEDIETGGSTFLIVDVLTDPTGQTYAQTARNDDGTYIVEYRDGGADRHYRTIAIDMCSARSLVTGWAFGIAGWHDSATWLPVLF